MTRDMDYGQRRQWCRAAEVGDYLATYEGEPEDDPGSRCGYSDSVLAEIRDGLASRDLGLAADDVGLRVVAPADDDLGWVPYVLLQDGYAWGASVTDEEHDAACRRMELYLTDHEGPHVSIRVRPARTSEAEGLYEVCDDGALLRADDETRERLRDLLGRAWQHALALHLPDFAAKVRRFLEMFDESVEDLAAATGIDVESIRALTAGHRTPTGDEVLILADHFLCDYKFFISNEDQPPNRTEKLFRAHSKDLTSKDRWSIQEFLFLCENEAFLSTQLGWRAELFTFKPSGTFFKGHGASAAAKLRAALGIEAKEVPEVFRCLRRLGMHVFRRRLENENISGLYINHPHAGPCLLVNYKEDVFRQRFTAAHEAAHAIFDADDEYVVSFDWTKGGEKHDLREVRANAFAGSFLVSTQLIAALPQVPWTEQRLFDLADQLQVNVKVLMIALERENAITMEDLRRFDRLRLPRHLKNDPELPDSLAPATRHRKAALLERGISSFYVELALEAHEKGAISTGRLAEMLLADEAELHSVAELYGLGGRI